MRVGVALVVAMASLAVFALLRHERVQPPEPPKPPAWERRVDVHTHLHPALYGFALQLFERFGTRVAVNLSSHPEPEAVQLLVEAGRRAGGRVVPFAGVDWRLLEDPGTFGARAADKLAACVEAGARGVKISKALGLGLRWPDGSLVAIDDPRLDPVFERAGALGVPVAVHVGDPVAFWEPPGEHNERRAELALNPQWSLYGQDVPSHRALLEAAERRYARHPRTTFIAVHVAGFPEDTAYVDRLLRAHPNVYVDIAARVPELGRRPNRDFFLAHQDRVLFGTDLGLGPGSIMLGAPLAERETPEDVLRFFSSTRRYLETADRGFAHPTPIQGEWTIDGVHLPPEVLEKIYVTNAERLIDLSAPSPAP